MIIYDLICICGYQFEAWFQGRADYDSQCQKGLLECPDCSGNDIHKILSPVAGVKNLPSIVPKTSASVYNSDTTPDEKEVIQMIKTVSRYVKKNYQDVGSKLAEKALKMHYGVEEEKKIRGVATAEEEKMLADEGIGLVKLPMPLDETKDEN